MTSSTFGGLNISPGEILVVHCHDDASLQQVEHLQAELPKWVEEHISPDVKILVVRGVQFSVLHPVCAPAADGDPPECVAVDLPKQG